jgi:hypothetical protein
MPPHPTRDGGGLMLDLDEVQARAEAAINPPSETALGQYKPAIASAMDVPALVAELRGHRRDSGDLMAVIRERDALQDSLRRHHEYIRGLTGEPCLLCAHEAVNT